MENANQFPNYTIEEYRRLIKAGETAQRFDAVTFLGRLNGELFEKNTPEKQFLKAQTRYRSAAFALVSLACANTFFDYINPFAKRDKSKYDALGMPVRSDEKPIFLPQRVAGANLLRGLGLFLHRRATLSLERDQTEIKTPTLASYWMLKMGLVEGTYPSQISLTSGARLLWGVANEVGGVKPFNETDLFTYNIFQHLHMYSGSIQDHRIAQIHNNNAVDNTQYQRTYQDVTQVRSRANCLEQVSDRRQFVQNFIPVDAKVGTQTYNKFCDRCNLKLDCGLFAVNMREQGSNLIPQSKKGHGDNIDLIDASIAKATQMAINLKTNITNNI
jgi:hypothetical protein